MNKTPFTHIFWTVALLAFLFGCNLPSPKQLPGDPTPDLNLIMTQIAAEQPTATAVPTAEPTAEPTEPPKKTETLTICLGKEPDTLFFYDESSQAMWSVLESIYDGPFDVGGGEAVPVIFDEILVTQEPVSVRRGDVIVDINGNTTEVKPNIVFMPAGPADGCSGKECLSSWTAVTESAEILQTVITFRLKDGLFWNDGTPLKAEDSVFSMTVNGMKDIHASKRTYNLTESYIALDDNTVEWRGLPGFAPGDPADVFWTPLPKHLMQGMSAEALRSSESVTDKPLGWGAWQIISWEKGQEIVAERNPYYTAPDGKEPFFDRIVYKFYGRPGDNNLEALHSGTCDIIDTSVDLGADLEPILEDVRDGKESIYIRPELTRQEIILNFDSTRYGAPDLFKSQELRTAVAQCIDRTGLIRQVLYGQSEIPVDFYPSNYRLHDPESEAIPYDPSQAAETLDALGWTLPEDDADPVRIASQVPGIIYGTKLSFTLTTGDSAFSRKAAEMIRDDLAQCGIEVVTESLPVEDLYAQGPDGIIFGRSFDAAMFPWSSSSRPCTVYMSDSIPNESNHWVGTNVGSYQNSDFDEACLLPDYTEANTGKLFASELPAIPLYFNISTAVSTNFICGLADKTGSRSILWNLESLSRSETPCAVSQWNDIYR